MQNNCYEFVVEFLNFINFQMRGNWNKAEVATQFIGMLRCALRARCVCGVCGVCGVHGGV